MVTRTSSPSAVFRSVAGISCRSAGTTHVSGAQQCTVVGRSPTSERCEANRDMRALQHSVSFWSSRSVPVPICRQQHCRVFEPVEANGIIEKIQMSLKVCSQYLATAFNVEVACTLQHRTNLKNQMIFLRPRTQTVWQLHCRLS